MNEYFNQTVTLGERIYRVAFHRGLDKPVLVARKTKHDETYLDIYGPTARRVIQIAREAR